MISGEEAPFSSGLSRKSLLAEINRMSKELLWFDDAAPKVMNPRNLTDQRGRTGLLLEYSIPHAINNLLRGINAGYVTSNQFGDFYFARGKATLWVEAKSLDLDAEEYAGNLATPLTWIPPTALLMIIVYQYRFDGSITFPHVLDLGVFDARTIAKCRDYGWLELGKKQILLDGASYQTKRNKWKREEGNLGKLGRIARIADTTLLDTPFLNPSERNEIANFRKFLYVFEFSRGNALINRVAGLVHSHDVEVTCGHNKDMDLLWITYSIYKHSYALVMRYSDLSPRVYSNSKIREVVPNKAETWIMVTPKFGYSIYSETEKRTQGRKINIETDGKLWEIVTKRA